MFTLAPAAGRKLTTPVPIVFGAALIVSPG